MSFNKIINILDNAKNNRSIITKAKFNKLFEILPAVDDGNCLFSSIEQLFSLYNLDELRQLVCEYYKTFDKNGDYPENSVKANLQIQMISDNEEEDGSLHEEKICTDFEWAGIMDVIALTDILNVNIIVMIMRKEGYTVQPFLFSKTAETLCIKYNGEDHFEPLLPKFELTNSLSRSSNAISSNTRSPNVISAFESAQDISPETLKLIQQMEEGGPRQLEGISHTASSKKPKSSVRKSTRQAKGITRRTRRTRRSRKH